MIYNKTCLFSATAGTNSITLSEPLSAFERYVVKVNPGVYWESVCTGDRSVQRYNRYGSYNNDGYMEWPANWVISNGTKSMSCNRFQLLMQLGTANKTQLFGWGNTAGNVKNIMEVWGINRKDYTTAQGEGKPEGDWKAYNETLLWSGTDYANQSHIDLANRAVGYERLKVGVGSFGESTNIYDVDAPQSYTSWLPLRSYWGTTTGSFYLSMHKYRWDNETSGLSAVSGKTWQLGTGAADPYTTTGNYTATDTFVRRPVWAIWGVNEKPKQKLIPASMVGGTISANRNSGYEHDITTITGVPAGNEWKCSAINITGAELTGNDFMFGNSNVTAQAEFEHSRDLTLVPNEHATLSADKMSGFSGDVVTVDATTDEGWYFTGLNVTGAVATGNKFMFIGENVTAEGLYTDEGYPITYENDGHGTLTGDTDIFIPGSDGVQLSTAYNTYYRFSGYDVTGGYIENGKLYPTGPCTAKAVYKPNVFTAKGNYLASAWHSNYILQQRYNNTFYAICTAKQSNVPNSFLTSVTSIWKLSNNNTEVKRTSNSGWNPTNVSNYRISGYTNFSYTTNNGYTALTCNVYNKINSTTVNSSTVTYTGKRSVSLNKSYTSNLTGKPNCVQYFSVPGTSYGPIGYGLSLAGAWSASGYAP